MKSLPVITSFTLSELEEVCRRLGEPAYRARQLLDWIYHKAAISFEAMTNLSEETRRRFSEYGISSSRIKEVFASRDGTRKLLIELSDSKCIETVILSEEKRITLCISTQVGCPVQCTFCASGRTGLIRSLESYEIVEEVLLAQQLLKADRSRINNIVIMGMGEPFLNYANLVKALTIITASWGFGVGTNKITVSTVGLPDNITRFAQEKVATNLAISLHAPNDQLRRKIIPLAAKVAIADIVKSARQYHRATGKDVTFEYLLLGGFNNDESTARELAKLLKDSGGKINLIAYNKVIGLPYQPPSPETISRFQNILRANGLVALLRKSRGTDIAAACGQLALYGRKKSGALPKENT